jgi:hypothetical protein
MFRLFACIITNFRITLADPVELKDLMTCNCSGRFNEKGAGESLTRVIGVSLWRILLFFSVEGNSYKDLKERYERN